MRVPRVRIKDLCRAVNVGHVGPSSMHRDPRGIPFLMGKNIGEGSILTHNIDRVTITFHHTQPKSTLHPGDVVVVRIGKSGQAAKIPESLADANCSGLVIIKQPLKIDPDYLVYFLNSPTGRSNSLAQARGSTRLTLNTESVANALVPVPELNEQRRIVRVLDDALANQTSARVNAEKNLESARALFENHLQAIFTSRKKTPNDWQNTTLAELVTIQSGSGFPTKFQGKVQGGIPFYKVSDMNLTGNETQMLHENNSITEQVRQELGAAIFPKGSVIFPKIGGAIATNKKRLTTRNCCVDNNVMGAIPTPEKIRSKFLFYFFSAHKLSDFANNAHLPSIRKTTLEGWPVCVPRSLADQDKMLAQLDALALEAQRLTQIYERQKAALSDLRQSLLHQAFTGNL